MPVQVDLSTCTELAPGVYQKNIKTYYIICSQSGVICYCNDVRLEKLKLKYGSLIAIGQKYISREAKQTAKSIEIPIKKPQLKEVEEDFTSIKKQLTPEQEKHKKELAEKKTAGIIERVRQLSTPRSVLREQTVEEMRRIDVCWRPDYFLKNRYCDGCIHIKQDSCGCKTKVFK